MKANCHLTTNVLHLAIASLLLASCYKDEFHPQLQGVSIRLIWDQPADTALLTPHAMTYTLLSATSDDQQTIQGAYSGADFDAPFGAYRALMYSSGSDGLIIEHPTDYAAAAILAKPATLPEIPPDVQIRDDDVLIHHAPICWSGWISNASSSEHGNNRYFIRPMLLASSVTIKIDNKLNSRITSVSGVLRGLVMKRRIVGGQPLGHDMGAYLFYAAPTNNLSPIITISCLGLYNPQGSVPYRNQLSMTIIFEDGNKLVINEDISDKLAEQMPKTEIATDVEIILTLTPSAGGDVDLDISIGVAGWQDGGQDNWTN